MDIEEPGRLLVPQGKRPNIEGVKRTMHHKHVITPPSLVFTEQICNSAC